MDDRKDPCHTNKKDNFTQEEVILSNRCHGMHLEGLKYDITPTGMHYLLIHYDIPNVDPQTYRLKVKGLVDQELVLSLDEIKAMPSISVVATMECAGNGRLNMEHRYWTHVPWNLEAVSTSIWKGVSLHRILARAGMNPSAGELVFTGLDKDIQGKQVQYFQRSLTLDEATPDEVILAYEMNGAPLLPQHGSPLRLVVPGWYGMTNVKWVDSIEAIDYHFDGYQMRAYSVISRHDEKVTVEKRIKHLKVRALMVPPGFPDFFLRSRMVEEAPVIPLEGRAWAGHIPIKSVEFSTDGGSTWSAAQLGQPVGKFAWTHWNFDWRDARPGKYQLCCRATDAEGNTQDAHGSFNYHAMTDTEYHMVEVRVATKDELRPFTTFKNGPEPDMHRPNL